MENPKQRHGNHTWDLILHYVRCPKCGYIMENREKFETHFHRLEKNIICTRCQSAFKMAKKRKPVFGPLLGHDPEVNE